MYTNVVHMLSSPPVTLVMSFLYEVINTLMSKLSNCVNYIFLGELREDWYWQSTGNRFDSGVYMSKLFVVVVVVTQFKYECSRRKSFSPRSSHIVSFIHSFIAVMRIHYWQFPLTIHGIHVLLNIFTYQRFAPVSPSVSRSDSDVLIVKYQKCNRNTEM